MVEPVVVELIRSPVERERVVLVEARGGLVARKIRGKLFFHWMMKPASSSHQGFFLLCPG